MSKNWMRHFELQLTNDNGKGVSLSDFKVTFDIEWFNIKFSRVALIKIYNLNQTTSNSILNGEFTKIKVIAGYDGTMPVYDASQAGRALSTSEVQGGQNIGEIYNGDIRFSVTGRDNPTDTYTLIQAIDGHEAMLGAVINTTIAKGYTVKQLYDVVMSYFATFGVTPGLVPEFPTTVFPRGRSIFAMAHEVMDQVAKMCKATWQIVDNKVDMVADNKYVGQEATVLNSQTGLIGMPQQTMGAGVNVRCLINPNIRVHSLIELDQSSVYRAALSSNDIQMSGGRITEIDENGNKVVSGIASSAPPASIATDGVYIVQSISYTGDTRGQAWYMDMMCFARGSADLQTAAARERG